MGKTTQFGRANRSRARGRAPSAQWPIPEFVLALLAVGALAYFALDREYVSVPNDIAPVARHPIVDAQFSVCTGSGGTCVIDGDTVTVDGVSIRIADIDTPEVRNYGCETELNLGRRATLRMMTLVNEGPFEIAPYERDEDHYGRKLRILERDGKSLGMILVSEGLARAWDGARRDWCV